MLNQTGIKKETLVNTHQILFNVQNQMSVGIKLAKNSDAADLSDKLCSMQKSNEFAAKSMRLHSDRQKCNP